MYALIIEKALILSVVILFVYILFCLVRESFTLKAEHKEAELLFINKLETTNIVFDYTSKDAIIKLLEEKPFLEIVLIHKTHDIFRYVNSNFIIDEYKLNVPSAEDLNENFKDLLKDGYSFSIIKSTYRINDYNDRIEYRIYISKNKISPYR